MLNSWMLTDAILLRAIVKLPPGTVQSQKGVPFVASVALLDGAVPGAAGFWASVVAMIALIERSIRCIFILREREWITAHYGGWRVRGKHQKRGRATASHGPVRSEILSGNPAGKRVTFPS